MGIQDCILIPDKLFSSTSTRPACMHVYKTSATLLSDYNAKEPLSDCLEVADMVQAVGNYLTDALL